LNRTSFFPVHFFGSHWSSSYTYSRTAIFHH
jgi:hypothetical protein